MKRISPSKSLVLSVAFVAATLACTPAFAAKKSKVAEDDGMSLMEMSDQLDRADNQDFQAAIERATSCTQARDFPCAESELTKAAKSANTGKDKKTLLASRQSLASEKQQLANEIRRAEEERQARIRREEQAEQAEQERQARVRRAEEEAEDRQSTRDYNAAIGAQILQGINENAAILGNIDRQTTAAYAETNRRLAAQAAERERVKAARDEREAERRRDARRSEEARQSRERLAQADTRDREDQRRKEAERAAERQREEQHRKDQQAQQERTRVSVSSSASTATGSSAQKYGATKTRLPHQPYAEPNPYDKGFLGGNTEVEKEAGWSSHSAGNGQTREAACSEARKKSQQEIARLSAHWRFDATSPCVCSVNVSADRSMLDAMAETGEPDHWFCAMYEKKTQIRDLGSRSR